MITVTDAAAAKIHEFMSDTDISPSEVGLRFAVRGGGCSGYEYEMGVDRVPPSDDPKNKTYDINGVKVIIDKKSALFLAGVTVDYVEGLMQSGFHIDNPNSKRTCGCGQSFST